MADRVNKEQRSRNMGQIRKFGNRSTEMRMVALLKSHRIKGWRRHVRLPGRPDFVFRDVRLVIFVDGCFWHNCPRCKWTPMSNVNYWRAKFAMNKARDRNADRALRNAGWNVLRIWEHSLKKPTTVLARISRLLNKKTAGV